MTSRPELIAHRGDPAHAPENTVSALRSALDAGAAYVEIDVHLDADGVPVLLHDPTLDRTAGCNGAIADLRRDQRAGLSVHEPQRFGDRFHPTPIPTLTEAADLCAAVPDVTLFVEVKPEPIRAHGTLATWRAIAAAMGPAHQRAVIISFERQLLVEARAAGHRIGWVLPEWNPMIRQTCDALAPEYLFVDHQKPAPDERFWPGPWRWAVYEVTDPAHALQLHARGADLIESMQIRSLLADPRLAPRGDAA